MRHTDAGNLGIDCVSRPPGCQQSAARQFAQRPLCPPRRRNFRLSHALKTDHLKRLEGMVTGRCNVDRRHRQHEQPRGIGRRPGLLFPVGRLERDDDGDECGQYGKVGRGLALGRPDTLNFGG